MSPSTCSALYRVDRRRRVLPQARTQPLVAEVPSNRSGECVCVTDGNEQAVVAIDHDLRNAAGPRRDDGRPDGERFDDAVREVLPARGEHGRIGGTEEIDDACREEARRAGERARRARVARPPQRRLPARRRLRRSPARRPSICATASSRTRKRLLRREPAGEDERVSLDAEAAPAARRVMRRGACRERGSASR